ncbi:MAG: dihydrolipoamide acetyltransferase family protein [Candidatus Sericytochromatia bacterium]
MAEFRMPSLGADMESGTLVEWLVKPGDRVERGDVVAVVETDKGAIDVEIFDSGTISQLVVLAGTKVPVGTVLARLNGVSEAVGIPEAAAPEVAAPAPTVVPPEPSLGPVVPTARLRASPLARRRAAELGIDLATVRGSRPGGAIAVADVEQAAALAKAPAPLTITPAAVAEVALPAPTERAAGLRSAIAAAMSRSNREIPHYYLGTEIDLKRALDWLEATNAKRPVSERLLSAALLLKAVALAVRDVPEMNGRYTDAGFQPSAAVHVGVAIFLRWGGLVAPAIHDTDQLSLDELMAKLRDVIDRARGGKLRSSEIADPTITVTNLGEQGVPTVYGLIYPPQVALVGFGKIVERPWAVDGLLGVRPILNATLAADHRVSDGHRGGRFLTTIDRLLQEPEKL